MGSCPDTDIDPMWQRAKPQLQVEVFTKAKKNNVNINFVIKDQYFSYFHGIQDAVNELSCLLIGDRLLPA